MYSQKSELFLISPITSRGQQEWDSISIPFHSHVTIIRIPVPEQHYSHRIPVGKWESAIETSLS